MTLRDPETDLLAPAQNDDAGRQPGDPPRPYPVDPIKTFSGHGAGEVLTDAQWHAQWGDFNAASAKKTMQGVSDVVQDQYTGPGSEQLPELTEALAEGDEERARQTAQQILQQAWPDKAEARNSVVIQAAMFQASVLQAGIVYTLDTLRDLIGGSRFAAFTTVYGGAAVVVIMRLVTG